MRIRAVAAGEDAARWRALLERFDPDAAELLKADAGTAVYRVRDSGRELVLKVWELGGGLARVKSGLRASRAWRHWRGARRLAGAGIGTAACHAIALERRAGTTVEWLVMDAAPGRTLLHELSSMSASTPGSVEGARRRALARAVGAQVSAFEAARLFNRDHKPSNILVEWPAGGEAGGAEAGDGVPALRVVDCVAIRRLGKNHWRGVRRMLASLVIEPAGCGVAIPRTARARVLAAFIAAQGPLPRAARRAALRAGWRSVEALVAAHGDPTPRIDPLA